MVYVSSNELAHYGILGMKWGIRRYQNEDGSLTEEGKKRYGTVENLEAGLSKRKIKQREAEKQAAIRAGDTKTIQKYSKELTEEEFNTALRRINEEQKLAELRQKDIDAGKAKLTTLQDSLGKIKTASESVVGIYNIGAKVYNSLNPDKKSLPVIGENRQNNDLDTLIKKVTLETKQVSLEQLKTKMANDAEDRAASKKKSDLDQLADRASWELKKYKDIK